MQTIPLYSLAIRPSDEICDAVRKIKQHLRKVYGQHYASQNSEAHITLFMFLATDKNYERILRHLKNALCHLETFDVKFSDFGEFERNGTFFVQPADAACTEIIERCEKVKPIFTLLRKLRFMESYRAQGYKNPHMSVARKTDRALMNLAKELYKKFDGKFSCKAFILRKFNPIKEQYEIVAKFPLYRFA